MRGYAISSFFPATTSISDLSYSSRTVTAYEKWISSHGASSNGTGSRESPFQSFAQVGEWLNSLPPDSGCQALLHCFPGRHSVQTLLLNTSLTIDRCFDCPPDPETLDQVVFELSDLPLAIIRSASFSLANVTLIGSQSSYSLLSALNSPSTVLSDVQILNLNRTAVLISVDYSKLTLVRCSMNGNRIKYNGISLENSHLAALIDARNSQVELHHSSFADNSFVLEWDPSSSFGLIGSSMVSAGQLSLVVDNCTFSNNHVLLQPLDLLHVPQSSRRSVRDSSSPSGATFYGGALLMHSEAITARVSRSRFLSNSIQKPERSSDLWTAGAGIGAKTGSRLTLIDNDFIGNSADIGAALYVVEDGRAIGSVSLVRISGGVVRHQECRIRGCGFAFHATTTVQAVLIDSVNFEHNKLKNPYAPPPGPVDPALQLSGGIAISYFVPYELPIDAVIFVSNSSFRSNTASY